jgi:glycine cleavage system H lipoate-binding protein
MKPGRETNRKENRDKPCIWMQAGVVARKHCKIDYNCPACHFDRAFKKVAAENRELEKNGMRPKGRRGDIVSWTDKMRERPPGQRPCLHHMKGRIDHRACTNDYYCSNCDFDQYFMDQYTVYTVVQPVDVLDVAGVKAPQGYYLHPGHAWAKIEEGMSVRIGIDDFALRMLGPLDRIDAPLIGKEVRQDQPGIVVHRGANAARVRIPVSGIVTAVNRELSERGNLANRAPYTDGWILQIHAGQLRGELRNLMIRDETQVFLSREIDRLYDLIEKTAGPLAADGGQLGSDIYGGLPEMGWERLSRMFLNT